VWIGPFAAEAQRREEVRRGTKRAAENDR